MRSSFQNISLSLLLRSFTALVTLLAIGAVLWACLALVFSFPLTPLRWPAAIALVGIALTASVRLRRRTLAPAIVMLVCATPVFAWWLTLTPHRQRHWVADMENTPWAEIAGDQVTVYNFRNCDRRTASDFTPRWEMRTFRLSSLQHLDFYMVYWDSRHICHTMMTFDFGADGRICASIEARREEGEAYSPLAGIFRRYELLYVLGDERDLVRIRAPLRAATDQVYLFRVSARPEIVRALFLDYVKTANALHERPAWYNSLTTNCSTLIRKHVKRVFSDDPWDWRIAANGHLDERLYEQGYLYRSLPLPELKARSFVNPAALAAGGAPDFSDRIRAGLPGF